MSSPIEPPARRFLHLCWCTDDGDEIVDFLAENLALRKTMETPLEPSSGDIFNMEETLLSAAAFVYDERGPRRAPAIEVQTWKEPKMVGEPPTDPARAGMQALGYAMVDLDNTVVALLGAGCSVVGRGTGPAGDETVVMREPGGVTIDLIRDREIDESSHLRHLRISVTDLDTSVEWYERMGWQMVDQVPLLDARPYGFDGAVDADVARLRLPDEATETILIQWNDPTPHGRHPERAYHAGLYRAALGVDDTRATYEALVAEGVEFDHVPMLVELHDTPVPDMWICFLRDPDGVSYEFVQRPRDAFRT